MKNFLIGTLAMFMVCLMFMSFSLLANEEASPKNEPLQNEVSTDESKQFTQASFFPFFGENFGFPMEFSKSHLLFLTIIISITLLVFAHKNNFETDIYAFYHTNRDGSISFETSEEQRSYEFRGFLARTFRILGIITSFASIILIII